MWQPTKFSLYIITFSSSSIVELFTFIYYIYSEYKLQVHLAKKYTFKVHKSQSTFIHIYTHKFLCLRTHEISCRNFSLKVLYVEKYGKSMTIFSKKWDVQECNYPLNITDKECRQVKISNSINLEYIRSLYSIGAF